MPSISVSGVGSGLDINKIVTDLVAAESQPATQRLDRREASIQAELSAIGSLKGALSEFRDTVSGLRNATKFLGMKATVGNEALLGASTTTAAQPGSYSVQVEKLAQAQKLASGSFASIGDTIGTGTLTFTFGTYDSVGDTFTENTAKPAKTLTIDPSNNTLAGLRDAINNADLGVRASIVNDGSGYRLVLASNETGAKNGLKITVSDGDGNDTDANGLSQLAFDPTTAGVKNLTQTVAAQDAELIVDGLTITSASNSVVGAVQGVTLNLKSAQPGVATELTIAHDTGTVQESVESFVKAYNTLTGLINEMTAYNPITREKGALLGDASVRSVTGQLQRIIGAVVPGSSGALRSLADIGISTQKDGTLALDTAKLQKAVETDTQGIAALFARTGRSSDPLISYVSAAKESKAGSYDVNVTQLATRGNYTGTATAGFPLTVSAGVNDSFTLKVNGVQSNAITLTAATYNTGEELATELQSRINADANLQKLSALVSVTFDTDHFVITSTRYGSVSKLESFVGSAVNDLGLASGTGAAGVDVIGTIGGAAATGAGQQLKGAGDAEGIVVDVLGGVTGSRGTVSLSEGVAESLDKLLNGFLKSEGLMDSRTASLNKRLSDIGDQRVSLQRRMDTLETRLRNQFTAMDSLVSQLTATGNFLTQQLAGLANIYKQDQ